MVYRDSTYGVDALYINLVVDTKQQAYDAREKLCPPHNEIPSYVYFEIWTSDSKFLAGRDCQEDYEMSQ